MKSDPSPLRTPARLERYAALGALGVLLLLATAVFRLSLFKYYSIDEFMHSHAAWLVGRGAVPFRDFCDFHFPLLYQLLSVPWRFMVDDPGNVLFLRLWMLPFVGLILVAAAVANRRHGFLAAAAAPPILLSIVPFSMRATEIRHDTVAFSLFLAGLSVLSLERLSPRARGALSGAFVALAVWGSQKVLLYGAPLAVVLVIEAFRVRAGARRSLLGSWRAVIAGSSPVVFLILLYLTATRSWGSFIEFCFRWALRWQAEYQGFSWRRSFTPLEDGWIWPLLLALVGLAFTLGALARTGRRAWEDPDVLLVCCLGSAFFYFKSLSAPYEYNLIPFFGLLAVFAARGLAGIAGAIEDASVRAGVRPGLTTLLFVGFALAPVAASFPRLEAFVAQSNAYQHEVLAEIGALTSPSDAAYDNSGSYVARPSASFYFYTDAPMRARLGDMLTREMPKSILARGCVLFVNDARFAALPEALRRFVTEHFQPLNADLWLWGQEYRADGVGHLDAEFLAVRKDRYFVEPASLALEGHLKVAGKVLVGPILELESGVSRVEFDGEPGREFRILWLPRTGQTWTPRPGMKPRFSRVL